MAIPRFPAKKVVDALNCFWWCRSRSVFNCSLKRQTLVLNDCWMMCYIRLALCRGPWTEVDSSCATGRERDMRRSDENYYIYGLYRYMDIYVYIYMIICIYTYMVKEEHGYKYCWEEKGEKRRHSLLVVRAVCRWNRTRNQYSYIFFFLTLGRNDDSWPERSIFFAVVCPVLVN